MPRIETIDLISPAGSPAARPRLVSGHERWPQAVHEELITACEGWPASAVRHPVVPVLAAFPLKKSSLPEMGQHFAVICTWGEEDIRHRCLLVPREEYALVGFDPYRLLAEQGAMLVPEIAPPLPLDNRPQEAGTRALVTDALQQLLQRGLLHLPLAEPDAECDRIMALLVAAIPVRTRADLRFASFCPGEPWLWNLAAMRQPGGSLVDWKRRALDLLGNDTDPEIAEYLREVAASLARGDMKRLVHLARSATLQPSLTVDRREVPATHPTPRRTRPAPPRPGGLGPAGINPEPETVGSRPTRPRRIVLEHRRLRPMSLPDARRPRRSPSGLVMALVLLGILGGSWRLGALPALHLDKIIGRLTPDRSEIHPGKPQKPPLVALDVGSVYEEILTRLQNRILEEGPEGESRRQALDLLAAKAARPLAEQGSATLEAATVGIRLGARPEREIKRLGSLLEECRDLTHDLERLALGWYSLAAGICWQDVDTLAPGGVTARCDSLTARDPNWRKRAEEALGLAGLATHLLAASGEVRGMQRLVSGFQTDRWSPAWQEDILAAARAVPPAASPGTRAYRNAAFALARLKDAEHDPASRAMPFNAGWARGAWPSAEVREVLPTLRRVAGMFRDDRAPGPVAGEVRIYALLADPLEASQRAAADAAFWAELNACGAVAFDPQVFEDVLGRVRFEALRPSLDRGDAPQDWPRHLTTLAAAPGVLEFREMLAMGASPERWRDHAGDLGDPFLRRWAEYEASGWNEATRERLAAFDASWRRMIAGMTEVRGLARSGSDWSASWIKLQATALDLLNRYVLAFDDNPVCRAQVAAASNLLETMSAPLPLRITGARVKIPGDQPWVLEAVLMPAGKVVGKTPVLPAGTKVTALDWPLQLGPDDWLRLQVRTPEGGRVLVQKVGPSLQEGGGPAALGGPLTGPGGTISLTVDPGYWAALDLPDLGAVF